MVGLTDCVTPTVDVYRSNPFSGFSFDAMLTHYSKKGGTMQVGDTIHLDGIKAEYSLFGKDRFSSCTLPDGNYIVLGFEEQYVKLAWRDSGGYPSRKHRYRIDRNLFGAVGHG